MLWGGSSRASAPLIGIKGQDLCLLYAEIFGNIKLEMLYNPGHVAVLLFLNECPIFLCSELRVGNTWEKHFY